MAALVTVGEAAARLGVDPTTLRRWERRGLVRPLRDYRGWRFYRPEDVERLRKWREPTAPYRAVQAPRGEDAAAREAAE